MTQVHLDGRRLRRVDKADDHGHTVAVVDCAAVHVASGAWVQEAREGVHAVHGAAVADVHQGSAVQGHRSHHVEARRSTTMLTTTHNSSPATNRGPTLAVHRRGHGSSGDMQHANLWLFYRGDTLSIAMQLQVFLVIVVVPLILSTKVKTCCVVLSLTTTGGIIHTHHDICRTCFSKPHTAN